MSRREQGIAASVASNLLVFGVYIVIVFRMYLDGRFDGADSTSLIGKTILVLFAASIAAHVLTQIVVSAVNYRAKRDEGPYVVDERDKLIELREMQAALIVFIAGFILSIVALALGGSPLVVFNLILLALTLGDTFGKLLKLRLYRRGF